MKKLRFLVSLHTKDNDFQIAQASAAKEAAHKCGVGAEITFADNNAVNQSTEILKTIQNRIESRPDAIVLEPVSGTALPQVARAASAAGIGWVVLNRDPEYMSELHKAATAPTFAVSSDHVEIGRIQGNNLPPYFRKVVRSCTLKDRRKVLRRKNVQAGCWRRNLRIYRSLH